MTDKKPYDLKKWMGYHNLILCILSFFMAVGTLIEAVIFFNDHGPWELYCAAHPRSKPGIDYSGRLYFWSWLFYASKYYEFVDTIFIVLRKKDLTVLHFYHHMVVVPLCYCFLYYKVVGFWHGVVWNGTIHTFMYYLYYLMSKGIYPSWKKNMTTAQIIQFVWGVTSFWAVPSLCEYSLYPIEDGAMIVFWFNQIALFSLLCLFINFYIKSYKQKRKEQ